MATVTDPTTTSAEALDTTVRLVTPERIRFQYPLAGPFRRSLAYLIDVIIIGLLVFTGSILASLISLGTSAGTGLVLVLIFVLLWGYGAFCEAVFNGQTPGKRALGIRVVSDQGVPITGAQAVLRNVLWAFDGIMFGYIPAVACMILTRKFQRLGDLAAGTMVMVEHQPGRGVLAKVDEPAVEAILPLLPMHVDAGPELSRALSDYVKHRTRLPRARCEEMAGHLARPLRRRYALPENASADAIVCALYRRVFLGD